MIILKNISLCNILIIPIKKGDRDYSHHPSQLCNAPHVFQSLRDQARENILAIFFLITKTMQMYVFF